VKKTEKSKVKTYRTSTIYGDVVSLIISHCGERKGL